MKIADLSEVDYVVTEADSGDEKLQSYKMQFQVSHLSNPNSSSENLSSFDEKYFSGLLLYNRGSGK